jgi:Holliday junction resolvasome RuvABC endonuclease subunit
MTALLGIDPGNSTGWALAEDGHTPSRWGTWRLTLKHGRGGRLHQLERHIEALHAEHGIGSVAYEEPFVGKYSSACMPLAAMAGVVQLFAARLGLHCLGYEPGEVKNAVGLGGRCERRPAGCRVMFRIDLASILAARSLVPDRS